MELKICFFFFFFLSFKVPYKKCKKKKRSRTEIYSSLDWQIFTLNSFGRLQIYFFCGLWSKVNSFLIHLLLFAFCLLIIKACAKNLWDLNKILFRGLCISRIFSIKLCCEINLLFGFDLLQKSLQQKCRLTVKTNTEKRFACLLWLQIYWLDFA